MLKFLIFFLLMSCSGYRYTQQDNPLSQYGIDSLSVPMFHNYSNQPEVSNHFTRETFRLLTSYPRLKIKSGYKTSTDAVLIGIVKSPEQIFDTTTPTNLRVAQDRASNAIGETRDEFYIPGTSNVLLYLQIIVIKKPTEEELTLLKSGIGDKIERNSRVIFNETIPLRSQYTREIFDRDSSTQDDGVTVNGTQNAGLQRKVIQSLAEQAAITVRDMILYAF